MSPPLRLAPGRGGLPCLRLLAADGASAEIYAQGAHLVSWVPAGERASRLFLSERAEFRPGAAIRGGVPVIFPQFGSEGLLPRHGFARHRDWEWLPAESSSERALFRLGDGADTRALWPQRFEARLQVEIGGAELKLTLAVHNRGAASFSFTAALHSYLQLGDLAAVALRGLRDCRYRDAVSGGSALETSAELRFDEREIDRIYFDTPPQLQLQEGRRHLQIESRGFSDTVVWNPGDERARALTDLEPGGQRRMLCVEAAVIGRPVELSPDSHWQGSQRLIAE